MSYLTASVIYGVIESDHLEDEAIEVLEPRMFYRRLDGLDSDTVICAYFGPDDFDLYKRIRTEYGIQDSLELY